MPPAVGWGASFVRNTLRFVDFFPFFYAAGFVTSLLNRDGKRLGDLAAGTVVVHLESSRADDDLGQERERVVSGTLPLMVGTGRSGGAGHPRAELCPRRS